MELQQPKTPPQIIHWVQSLPDWVEVRRPANEERLNLDKGEEQAIALALELTTPILLDEKKARAVAESKGLIVIGTIGLLERAAAMNLLDLESAFASVQRTNMRVHRTLMDAALKRHLERRKPGGRHKS